MTAFEELQQLIYYNLIVNAPILSENTQNMISALGLYGLDPVNNEARILVTAPSYDMNQWKKNKVIIHNYDYDYAKSTNERGGFGKHNDSEHWVNRVINKCCEEFARRNGGRVEKYLPE